MDRIETIDEFGKKTVFELIDTFGMNDSEYAVLDLQESEDLYILKIKYDNNGEMTLEGIDDEELESAIEVYEELKRGSEYCDS